MMTACCITVDNSASWVTCEPKSFISHSTLITILILTMLFFTDDHLLGHVSCRFAWENLCILVKWEILTSRMLLLTTRQQHQSSDISKQIHLVGESFLIKNSSERNRSFLLCWHFGLYQRPKRQRSKNDKALRGDANTARWL